MQDYANWAYTISADNLRKLLPEEMKALESHLRFANLDIENLCSYKANINDVDNDENILFEYADIDTKFIFTESDKRQWLNQLDIFVGQLEKRFQEVTEGLNLYYALYGYDDNECFFGVENVLKLTPAGEKFIMKYPNYPEPETGIIDYESWVTYG
jgi:hypothetical protein